MMKIGICIGHSRKGDRGAVSQWGETEWDYNSKVAGHLKAELEARGVSCVVIDDYRYGGYSSGIRHCAKLLRDAKVTHAVELHFNSAGASANGAEWLHWHSSGGGKRLAEGLRRAFVSAFPMVRDRGLKARQKGQRGALFLRATHCPAVILEPFFGSSAKDAATFRGGEKALARAYAEGLTR